MYEIYCKLRDAKGCKDSDVAKATSITKSTFSDWKSGRSKPKGDKLKKIADFFNVTIEYLSTGNETPEEKNVHEPKISHKRGVIINVLGRVAAGIPIDAIQEIIDTEEITEEMAKAGTYFGLKIKGDSMTPTICDGDIVIVRQQDDAETGDVVIATINGDEATCKRLRKYNAGIELISNNPSYPTFEFSNEEILDKPVKIIGKVVELRRKF